MLGGKADARASEAANAALASSVNMLRCVVTVVVSVAVIVELARGLCRGGEGNQEGMVSKNKQIGGALILFVIIYSINILVVALGLTRRRIQSLSTPRAPPSLVAVLPQPLKLRSPSSAPSLASLICGSTACPVALTP